jgi:hypothetical protein
MYKNKKAAIRKGPGNKAGSRATVLQGNLIWLISFEQEPNTSLMKYLFYSLTAIILIASASCQKETDTPGPGTIDSLKAVLPKQIFYTDLTLSPANGTDVASIKYDTANGKIELYIDDTTNSNPYDQLATSYIYNKSGYLVSHKIFDAGVVEESYSIERSADNKVINIAHLDNFINIKDTTFFNYQIVSGGTKITTIEHFYYPASPVFIDTTFYTYNTDFKLTQILKSGGAITTYEYNTNNSIKKLLFLSPDISNETNFFYTSGLADGKEDVLLRTILGKDFYIQNIKNLYYFTSFADNEYITVSATDPYHPTRMQDIGNNNGFISTEERTWSYELNAQQLLSKVTGSLDGVQDAVIRFKY